MKEPIIVDFETKAIEHRPKYPPKSAGVAIQWPGRKGRYYAYGHPAKNNCDWIDAKHALQEVWDSGLEITFHNSKFDVDVACTEFGLKMLPWDRIHDTLFMLFLHDPDAFSLSLKPSAQRLLGMDPEEQDAVIQWLLEHKIIQKNTKEKGAYIAEAPGDLVGKYAIGDLTRTRGLLKYLWPKLDAKERVAYDRERKVMPILLKNEQMGLRVDPGRMERDLKIYTKALADVEAWLRKRLKCADLNLDNDTDVGERLAKLKIVTEWVMTKGGNGRPPQRSVAKDNLTADKFNDREVSYRLSYRNKLAGVMKQNLLPWLEQCSTTGRIYTEWNQVRQGHGNDKSGTRTGRLSASRFLNVVKDWYKKDPLYRHPKGNLPELPKARCWVLPEEGHLWNNRDWRQQEFRIEAHFEPEGWAGLREAYLENPLLDPHDEMTQRIRATGFDIDRELAKQGNLAHLYRVGADTFAKKYGVSVADAHRIKRAVSESNPAGAELYRECVERAKNGLPVRTWGGRRYFCEKPAVAKKGSRKGQIVSFEYKQLNRLVQGSAADAIKEAIIRYDSVAKHSRMLIAIHDELNISAPKDRVDKEDKLMREVMESLEFDIPMLTDRKVGPTWGDLKKVK